MEIADYELANYHIKGIAVAVISPSDGVKIWCKGKGKDSKLVTQSTLFQVGSISKWVTAWGVIKLYQDQEIDIDKEIKEYLHDLQKGYSVLDKVTIRQLLSHTAGLGRKVYLGKKITVSSKVKQGNKLTNQEVYNELRKVAEPGEKFIYTGSGYFVLQMLIEQVSGIPFAQYMKENIFYPMSMMDSDFEIPQQLLRESRKSNVGFGKGHKLRDYRQKAAAGMYSNIIDLLKFAQANMEYGNKQINEGILDVSLIKDMHTRISRELPYGLGNYIYTLPGNNKIIMHDGLNLGWMARMMMLPQKGHCIIILCNGNYSSNCINNLTYKWLKEVIGEINLFYKGKLGFPSLISLLKNHG